MRNYELSALEQKRAYKQVQEGGEPPLFGFRKTQPEKLKGLVYIKYKKYCNAIIKIYWVFVIKLTLKWHNYAFRLQI